MKKLLVFLMAALMVVAMAVAGCGGGEKKADKAEKAKTKKPSVFSKIAAWFRGVRAALKKIVWTSPKVVRANTIMVLVVIVIFAVATGLVDAIFNQFIYVLGLLI